MGMRRTRECMETRMSSCSSEEPAPPGSWCGKRRWPVQERRARSRGTAAFQEGMRMTTKSPPCGTLKTSNAHVSFRPSER
jgi:hypothetical protein